WDAYAQSKTANVLFAVEATNRWAADGITVNALQPGTVRSNLQRYITDEELHPRCCSRPHRSCRESAAATSKTATKQDQANPAPVVASPPTRSTLTRRRGSGRSPSRRWHPDDNPQYCVLYPDVTAARTMDDAGLRGTCAQM